MDIKDFTIELEEKDSTRKSHTFSIGRVRELSEDGYLSSVEDDLETGRTPPVMGENSTFSGGRGSFLGTIGLQRLSSSQSLGFQEERPETMARTLTWGLFRSLGTNLENSFRNLTPKKPSTFYCQICLETKNLEDEGYSLKECGHSFCVECLRGFLHLKVIEAQIAPRCFYSRFSEENSDSIHSAPCNIEINSEDIRAILSQEDLPKYERFLLIKGEPNNRECPFCQNLQLGNPEQPAMWCNACKKQFCFAHANAHEGFSCAEYEVKLNSDEQFIREISKPCPGCSIASLKSGGCNQMKCSNCGTSFCWLCLKPVEDGTFPSHFQWWNINGCPNLQLQEGDQAPSPSMLKTMKILSFLQIIIFGPIAAVMTVISYLTCCCCILAVEGTPKQKLEGVFSCWGNACMGFFAALFLPIIGPIICCCYCCCGKKGFKFRQMEDSQGMAMANPMQRSQQVDQLGIGHIVENTMTQEDIRNTENKTEPSLDVKAT